MNQYEEMEARSQCLSASSAPAALLGFGLLSCGAGVAGVVATSGSDGGGHNFPPQLLAFDVVDRRVSPATLRFVVDDPEGDSLRVELFYEIPGNSLAPMQHLDGFSGNAVLLVGGRGGRQTDIRWDFATELGTAGFVPDIRLVALLDVGGTHELPFIPLGNDPPLVASVTPLVTPGEDLSGVVTLEVEVADSSADVVDLAIEWSLAGSGSWQPATVAFDAMTASPAGSIFSPLWLTGVDLDGVDDLVQLRVTPDDGARDRAGAPVGRGAPFASGALRIDNNEEPIVQLSNDLVLFSPDDRLGIPIPFRVFDEEGDRVEVILQWRSDVEEFPALPTAPNELDALLSDLGLRREHHVCTPYPRFARGRVIPLDATSVRLPELAASESWILQSGLEGHALEILRPSSIPAPVTPTWASNPLVAPIGALPVGDGLAALVLDAPGNARLREIELATGRVVREIAAFGPGDASALAFERGERAVLVALDDAGSWRIERVELASGAVTELILSDASEPGPVRAIASLGSMTLGFSVGSSVFHLDYRNPLDPRLGRLLGGLATPWGIAADPSIPDRLFVAERDADRILEVELASRGWLPVVASSTDMQLATLEEPTALAFEPGGPRLLVVASSPAGGTGLHGLELGATAENVLFPIGDPAPGEIASVASGPDGLRLAVRSLQDELWLAGGVVQRRTIRAFEPGTQRLLVEPAFAPAPRVGELGRIPAEGPRRASPDGVDHRFVWDSREAAAHSVFLRAVARDAELGLTAEGSAPRSLHFPLEVEPIRLGGGGTTQGPRSVAADIDRDGDLDIVSANESSNDLTVFSQATPGSFAANPIVIGGLPTTNAPTSVVATDLDGDGDTDLVSANVIGHDLTIFRQEPTSSFGTPLILGGSGTTNNPGSVAAADLDGDGDLDLVSANRTGANLTVFLQHSPGGFASAPLVLGGSATTQTPFSVATGDLDGDGDVDLVSANLASDSLSAFFQLAPGTFGVPLVLGDSANTMSPTSVLVVDLDADGGHDILAACPGSFCLTAFLQFSPGVFFANPLVLGFGTTTTPVSVAVADLDADGIVDVVSANSESLTVFPQSTSGSFAAPLVLGNAQTTNGPMSVAAADIDGDGNQDLASSTSSAGMDSLTVFLQGSSGNFESSPTELGGGVLLQRPWSIAAADLDGDGDIDLASASQFSGTQGFFQGLPRSFGAPRTFPLGSSSIAAADVDGDGSQDLVTSSVEADVLIIAFQTPRHFETFASVGGPTVIQNPVFVSAADLDGDGDIDLASANRAGDDLAVFLQLTPRSFGTPTLLGGPGTTDAPFALAAADLDQDGDLDLASANFDGDDLTVFFQLAPGIFGEAPLVLGSPATNGPRGLAAADLDADGDIDLASANHFRDKLTVFFQQTPGAFATFPLLLGDFRTTNGPNALQARDLDRDGDEDLVAASSETFGGGSNSLAIFFQSSMGGFAASPLVIEVFPPGESPVFVVAADLDGDGDEDLTSANEVSNNLTIFWGGR